MVDTSGTAGVKPPIEDPPPAGIPDAGSNFNAAEQLRLKLRGSKRTHSELAALQPGIAEQLPGPVTTGEEKRCTAEEEGKEGESSAVSRVVDGELGNSSKKVATPSIEEQPSLSIHPEEMKEAQQVFDGRVKNKTRKNLDAARDTVKDNVRLWEPGWKERYYSDKCKVVSCIGKNAHTIADMTHDRHTSYLSGTVVNPHLISLTFSLFTLYESSWMILQLVGDTRKSNKLTLRVSVGSWCTTTEV